MIIASNKKPRLIISFAIPRLKPSIKNISRIMSVIQSDQARDSITFQIFAKNSFINLSSRVFGYCVYGCNFTRFFIQALSYSIYKKLFFKIVVYKKYPVFLVHLPPRERIQIQQCADKFAD